MFFCGLVKSSKPFNLSIKDVRNDRGGQWACEIWQGDEGFILNVKYSIFNPNI